MNLEPVPIPRRALVGAGFEKLPAANRPRRRWRCLPLHRVLYRDDPKPEHPRCLCARYCGSPVRDQGSTTYVAALETDEQFGLRLYTEV